MTYDLAIRGGTVVDGSGASRRRADVGITDGRIVAVGTLDERGREELDAEGHVVAPGFVDSHTHMDAQLFWDEAGTPSCWHGVTSVVMGNCGFTLAPARPDERALVVRNLERAEDISAAAMAAGITWTWATFAEYLDAVEATPKGINYAGSIGHSALRTWAMGERAFTETASDDDLEVMRHELSDALRAGAVGFTTSRSASHWTSDDRPVASRVAAWDEVVALVEFMGQQGAGVFQLAPEPTRRRNGEPNDFDARLQQLALSTGVPVVYGVIAQQGTALIDDTVARGGRMYGLTHSRGVSMVQSFLTTLAFDVLPEWQEVRSRPLDEQRVLLRDPAVRARLVHAANHGDYAGLITAGRVGPRFEWMDVLLTGSGPNPTVAEVAAARGVDPVEAIIDLALDHDLDLFFLQYFDDRDPERVLALMRNPNTAMTFSDSGAHVSQVIDSSIHSYLLGSWVRERELLSLEEAVAMMTSRSARIFGLHDRGLLAEGYAADVTVFDPATVAPSMPRLVYDLPGGARRLEQRADGIRAVVVNGGVLLRDGELTEERSGRLLRAGQLQPS